MAEAHLDLSTKFYEHDVKGKHMAKACESMTQAMKNHRTEEFFQNVIGDLQLRVINLIQKSLIDKIDDQELLCTIYEMMFQRMHPKMRKLIKFIGSELHSVYYKLACEICDKNKNLEEGLKYLAQCKSIARKIGLQEVELIHIKYNEIKKQKKMKEKHKVAEEARKTIQEADQLFNSEQFLEALKAYKLTLKLARDKDPEIEARCHFKIAKVLTKRGKRQSDLEQARNHIVDFQIQCQMIKTKDKTLQQMLFDAVQILQQLQANLRCTYRAYQQQKGSLNSVKKDHKEQEPLFKPLKQSPRVIIEQLHQFSGKPVFELFQYMKATFKVKTEDIDLPDSKTAENSKIRKTILKFISIFHPDKQNQDDREFYSLAEEITKQFNQQLKLY
ncbi:hypothetical protein FGO68_gene2910 [Halteria grandinella]|uniref:Uncharacterized protein n=1 Tax=Halteria grandinella TaxID=5974 RepID=A0A8J8T4B5_HALGN|nr:hypothetical protein FGO68_gene2910 [Halteria grandinella]